MDETEAPRELTEDSPIWCVVGNIVLQRPYGEGGRETRAGTRLLRPGAKVVCALFRWGGDMTNVLVVGRHRGSNAYLTTYIRAEWLTNLRAELVRSPAIIRRVHEQYAHTAMDDRPFTGSAESEAYVQKIVSEWLPLHYGVREQPQVSTRTSQGAPGAGEEPHEI